MTNKVIIILIIIIIIIIITNCHLANMFDEFFSKTSTLVINLEGQRSSSNTLGGYLYVKHTLRDTLYIRISSTELRQ